MVIVGSKVCKIDHILFAFFSCSFWVSVFSANSLKANYVNDFIMIHSHSFKYFLFPSPYTFTVVLFHVQLYAHKSTRPHTFWPQPHTSPSHSWFVWQVHHLLDATRIYKCKHSSSHSSSSCSSSIWCLPGTWPGTEECCSYILKLLPVVSLWVSLSAFLVFLSMNSIASCGQCFNLEPPLKQPQPHHHPSVSGTGTSAQEFTQLWAD